MGEKFELKHLIRLVFWRKKPHIVTDIGGGAVAGALAYRPAVCALLGVRAFV